ncbi:MAG: hypothetical protein R8M45_04245 [Ghiorsea sp.]
MFDLITYTKDSVALLAEVTTKFPERIIKDDNDVVIGIQLIKTPTIRNGLETLAVVRVDAARLAEMKTLTTLKILAEVPMYGDLLAKMTVKNRAIYDRVHDQTPYDVTLEDGTIQTITPPELIGGFA